MIKRLSRYFSLIKLIENNNGSFCYFGAALKAANSLSPCSFVRWIDSREKSTTLTIRSKWAIDVMSRPTDESRD